MQNWIHFRRCELVFELRNCDYVYNVWVGHEDENNKNKNIVRFHNNLSHLWNVHSEGMITYINTDTRRESIEHTPDHVNAMLTWHPGFVFIQYRCLTIYVGIVTLKVLDNVFSCSLSNRIRTAPQCNKCPCCGWTKELNY